MLSYFPRDVLDEIWDLIGSVSEGFHTYFCYALFPRSSFTACQIHLPALSVSLVHSTYSPLAHFCQRAEITSVLGNVKLFPSSLFLHQSLSPFCMAHNVAAHLFRHC